MSTIRGLQASPLERLAAGWVPSWAEVSDVGTMLRRRFEELGVSPEVVVRWCPYGDRTPGNRDVGWTPRRLAKFVGDVSAHTGWDGGAVLARAVEIGVARDVETANAWQLMAGQSPARLAEGVMASRSEEALRLCVASRQVAEIARPVAPGSSEDRRAAAAWVQMVGAFKARDVRAWMEHPSSGLHAPVCPFIHEGWAEFGAFVPWMVSAGYTAQNAPSMTGPAAVAEAVSLVRSAVVAWDSGVVDVGQRWWSDDWYRSVGFPEASAELFRGVGWEPPLAAFLTRWVGRVKPKTLVSRLGGVPVSLLRRIWREGLVGLETRGGGLGDAVPWTDLAVLMDGVGPERAEEWVGRFGTVAVAGRLVKWGLTPETLARVDAAWPGHQLFRWVDGMWSDSTAFRNTAPWLDVAIETAAPGAQVNGDAHVGVVSSLPGWVADFHAAGVTDPHEALALVRSGTDRDSLRMLAALLS